MDETMAPESAARLAAVLDVEPVPAAGDEVPMLWHWAYFREPTPQSSLGEDGHARRVDALARRLPRRMAASGTVTRLAPLVIGRPAERSSQLLGITEKDGRSGPLAFANWRHVVEQSGAVVLEETQTVVYRASAGPSGGPRPEVPASAETDAGAFIRDVHFEPSLLFRYSAVTWNSHRIHYDSRYATEVEGYPGLVVHGPLLATLLAREATARLGTLGAVDYRARSPVFVDDIVHVFARDRDGGGLVLEARTADQGVAMTLSALEAV